MQQVSESAPTTNQTHTHTEKGGVTGRTNRKTKSMETYRGHSRRCDNNIHRSHSLFTLLLSDK